MKEPTKKIIKLREAMIISDIYCSIIASIVSAAAFAYQYHQNISVDNGLPLLLTILGMLLSSLVIRFAFVNACLHAHIRNIYDGNWYSYKEDDYHATAWFKAFKKRCKIMEKIDYKLVSVMNASLRKHDLWSDEVLTSEGIKRIAVTARSYLDGATFNDLPILNHMFVMVKGHDDVLFKYAGIAGKEIPYDCFSLNGILYQLD
jgi:hypothetical protein